MKNKIQSLIIILSITIISTIVILNNVDTKENNILASEISDDSIENMDMTEVNDLIANIILGMMNHDKTYLYNNPGYFTRDTFDKIENYIDVNNILTTSMSEIVIDYTYPQYSSTSDTVIMANAKLLYDGQSYNKLWLFEFHVDSYGDIYGFNVWQY